MELICDSFSFVLNAACVTLLQRFVDLAQFMTRLGIATYFVFSYLYYIQKLFYYVFRLLKLWFFTMSDREIANIVWLRIKGKPIPDYYTDEDCEEIIYRYWHKCMEGQAGWR